MFKQKVQIAKSIEFSFDFDGTTMSISEEFNTFELFLIRGLLLLGAHTAYHGRYAIIAKHSRETLWASLKQRQSAKASGLTTHCDNKEKCGVQNPLLKALRNRKPNE